MGVIHELRNSQDLNTLKEFTNNRLSSTPSVTNTHVSRHAHTIQQGVQPYINSAQV